MWHTILQYFFRMSEKRCHEDDDAVVNAPKTICVKAAESDAVSTEKDCVVIDSMVHAHAIAAQAWWMFPKDVWILVVKKYLADLRDWKSLARSNVWLARVVQSCYDERHIIRLLPTKFHGQRTPSPIRAPLQVIPFPNISRVGVEWKNNQFSVAYMSDIFARINSGNPLHFYLTGCKHTNMVMSNWFARFDVVRFVEAPRHLTLDGDLSAFLGLNRTFNCQQVTHLTIDHRRSSCKQLQMAFPNLCLLEVSFSPICLSGDVNKDNIEWITEIPSTCALRTIIARGTDVAHVRHHFHYSLPRLWITSASYDIATRRTIVDNTKKYHRVEFDGIFTLTNFLYNTLSRRTYDFQSPAPSHEDSYSLHLLHLPERLVKQDLNLGVVANIHFNFPYYVTLYLPRPLHDSELALFENLDVYRMIEFALSQ
jgi:hypothetical protein